MEEENIFKSLQQSDHSESELEEEEENKFEIFYASESDDSESEQEGEEAIIQILTVIDSKIETKVRPLEVRAQIAALPEMEIRVAQAYRGAQEQTPNMNIDNIVHIRGGAVKESNRRIHQSTVIGWTNTDGETFVTNRERCHLTNEIERYSYEIFPVITMAPNDRPVQAVTYMRDMPRFYGFGNYLIYTLIVNDPIYWRAQIVVKKKDSREPHDLRIRYSRLFLYAHIPGLDIQQLSWIMQILDISNTAFGVYGLYGGGTLPPHPQRLTWDEPRKGYVNEGEASVRANMRSEIDYQSFGERIGYLCSKDSLMNVSEYRPRNTCHSFSSLLKEYTFAIIDGRNWYQIRVSDQEMLTKIFKMKDKNYVTLSPYIVITSEGVSSLSQSTHMSSNLPIIEKQSLRVVIWKPCHSFSTGMPCSQICHKPNPECDDSTE